MTLAYRKPHFLSKVHAPPVAPARFEPVRDLPHPSPVAPVPPAAPAPVAPPAPTPAAASPATTAQVIAIPSAPSPETLERLELAVKLLRSQAELLAEQARADALELGFLVARRILEREIQTDPSALLGLVRSAIARAGETQRVTLRLHPQDADIVRAATSEPGGNVLTRAIIEITPDLSLSRGDCVVESNLGKVDGRLSTRLSEMREAVAVSLAKGEA